MGEFEYQNYERIAYFKIKDYIQTTLAENNKINFDYILGIIDMTDCLVEEFKNRLG